MNTDHGEGEVQPLIRPMKPGRRRLVARSSLTVVVIGAFVAGGAYWKLQAPARAQHRYEKQLVGAQAAWPGVQARIAALPLPAGWVEDVTETACTPEAYPTTRCLVTNARDTKQAMVIAAAMLREAGASDHDPLMAAFKATLGRDGSQLGGCDPTVSRCETSLGWDGASVRVAAKAGSDLVEQPVAVLISRGVAYPPVGTPASTDAVLPGDPKTLGRLTGVTGALGPLTCGQRPKTGPGCLVWNVVVTSPRRPAEVQHELARILAAHGFRLEAVPPEANQHSKHVIARLNRGAHSTDSVVAFAGLRPSPTGDGTTVGTVHITAGIW